MKKQIIITGIVCAIIFGGVGYALGKKYSVPSPQSTNDMGVRPGMGKGGAGMPRQNRMEGFTTGEVLAKDDTSITLKLRDGSTKIIFVSPSTELTRPVKSTISDVTIGVMVMAQGKEGADGTITATSLQVRENLPSGNALSNPQK